MSEIRGLQENPKKGASVEVMLGISTPYRFLHVEQNYAFYRLENDTVFVTDFLMSVKTLCGEYSEWIILNNNKQGRTYSNEHRNHFSDQSITPVV